MADILQQVQHGRFEVHAMLTPSSPRRLRFDMKGE
jgi:hypothetical protein